MSNVIIAPPEAPSTLAPATAVRPFAGTVAESLAVAVAPTTGRFRPASTVDAAVRGQVVGHITGGRGRADEVRMPVDGTVRSLLVRPGQLVRRGQALAWVERTERASV